MTDKLTNRRTRLSMILEIGGLTYSSTTSLNEQQTFLDAYLGFTGTPEQFWTSAPALLPSLATKLDDVRKALLIGIYTLNHPPMVKALWSASLRTPEALAKLTRDDWLTDYIDTTVSFSTFTNIRVGAPIEIVGDPPTVTADDAYADALVLVATSAFPSSAMAQTISQSSDASLSLLKTFFTNNPSFDFLAQPVSKYAADNPATFPSTQRPDVERMARLFRISPQDERHETALALWNAGFDSARRIALMSQEAFIQQMDGMPASTAKAIHERASQTAAAAVVLATSYGAAFNYPGVGGAIPQITPPGGGAQLMASALTSSTLPDWARLFGSLDYCNCDECQSVFGAAAYLTDVLHFLSQRPTSAAPSLTAFTSRRPDVTKIKLSCTNTSTVLPQIDLVNEILENEIAGTAPAYQTTWSAEDLAIHPENVNNVPYTQLAAAVYPWSLPYNRWIDEERAYLALRDVRLWEIRDAFAADVTLDEWTWFESLGLTVFQRDIIADYRVAPFTTIPATLKASDYWGIADGTTWWAPLTALPEFLRASGLTYEQATALFATSYVKAASTVTVDFDDDDPCNLEGATLVGLNASALDRIHRLERLRRALGWTAHAVDRAVMLAGGGQLRRETISWISSMLRVVERTDATVDEVLTWVTGAPIDTTPDPKTGISVFEKLFIAQGDSAAFKLNAARTALADETSRNLNQYYPNVATGLGTSVDSLIAIATFAGVTNAKLSLATLSTLYSYTSLARALDLTGEALASLLAISGRTPFNSTKPFDALLLVDDAARATSFKFKPQELRYLLWHVDSTTTPFRPADTAIASVLSDLRAGFARIAASAIAGDPDGSATKKYLDLLLPSNPTSPARDLRNEGYEIIVGTSSKTEAEQNAFIHDYLTPFVDEAEAIANLTNSTTKLETAEARLAYMAPKLQVHADKRALVISSLATAFGVSNDVMAAVLSTYLHARTAAGAVDAAKSALTFLVTADSVVGDFTQANAGAYFATYLAIHKVATIVGRLELPVEDLPWTFQYGPLGLDQLPLIATLDTGAAFGKWSRLVDAVKLRDDFADRRLFDLLVAATTAPADPSGTARAALLKEVAKRTGWSEDHMTWLCLNLNPHLNYPADFLDEKGLIRIKKALGISTRLKVHPQTMFPWIQIFGAPANVTDAQLHAGQVKEAMRGTYMPDAWRTEARPVRDALRERERDALVSWALEAMPTKPYCRTDADTLADYLLTDLLVSPAVKTSRVKHAMGSVQTFVQRILLDLEPDIKLSPDAANQWTWMKNYRVWEANRRIFIYPENWIEPELRDDKSDLFKALESDLLKQDVSEDSAQAAVLTYLRGLEDLTNLEIAASAVEDRDEEIDEPSKLHVLARTRTMPHVYYYRAQVGNRSWTAWEKIDFEIEGDHVFLSAFDHRVYLIWGRISEASGARAPSDGSGDKKRFEVQLRWSSRYRSEWTKVQQSKRSLPVPPDAPSMLLAPELQVEYREDEGEDLVSSNERFERAASRLTLRTYVEGDSGNLRVSVVNTRADGARSNTIQWGYVFRLSPGAGYTRAEQDNGVGGEFALLAPSWTQVRAQMFVSPRPQTVQLPSVSWAERDKLGSKVTDAQPNVLMDIPTTFTVVPTCMAEGMSHFGWAYDPMFFQDPYRCYLVTPSSRTWFEKVEPKHKPEKTPSGDTTGQATNVWAMAGVKVNFDVSYTVTENDPYSIPLYTGATYRLVSESRFTFEPFYHPFVKEMISAVNREGLDGLYTPRVGSPLRRQAMVNETVFADTYTPTDWVKNRPKEEFDFSDSGAYSLYNWETFVHVPMLIATRLAANQKFEEARVWFDRLFNPTAQEPVGISEPSPQRYWNAKPFYELSASDDPGKGPIAQLLLLLSYGESDPARDEARDEARRSLENQIADWRKNPFSPHRIARLRPVAYQKTIVMKYLDMLIAWGDQLFASNTIESINEATELYRIALRVLGSRPVKLPASTVAEKSYEELVTTLDAFSNALVEIENELPPIDWTHEVGPVDATWDGPSLYFCIPPNDKLLSYWDIVEDRLYKVRHALNLEGVEQELPLFEPAIDPAILVRAVAAGVDISSVLADVSAPLPYQRFAVLSQRASELVNELKAFGNALLSAIEKGDAEELANLRADNEVTLLNAVRLVKGKAIDEAVHSLAALSKSAEAAKARFDYYSSRTKTNKSEDEQVANFKNAGAARIIAQVLSGVGSAAAAAPDVQAGISGGTPPTHSTINVGGSKAAAALYGAAAAASGGAAYFELQAQLAGSEGSFQRRAEDWALQANIAQRDMQQLAKQIDAANHRVAMLKADIDSHDIQRAQAADVRDHMLRKYSNGELYGWMVGKLSETYLATYKLAYDMAKRAERALKFELADDQTTFVSFGYWDSMKKGLLAGEDLGLALRRMEAAYLDRNKREYELTRHIPLTTLDPFALQMLREMGSCLVNVPEALFDQDSPGHYLRRIRHVAVTITGTTGPYTPVRCTLTLLSSQVRTKASLDSGALKSSNVAVQSIVTSSGREDGGLFEANMRDERYLPFEGAGAVSHWRLELPTKMPTFDYRTISEVVLHFQYTAREGGQKFRDEVNSGLKKALDDAETDNSSFSKTGSFYGFSVKSAFSDAWFRFLSGDGANPVLSLDLDYAHIPFKASSGVKIKELSFVLVGGVGVTLTVKAPSGSCEDVPLTAGGSTVGQPFGSITYKSTEDPTSTEDPRSPENPGTWNVACFANDWSSFKQAQDLYVVVNYTVS